MKRYTEDLKAGQDYKRLHRCVSIGLLDFKLTERERYHSRYRLREADGTELTDLLEIHIVELSKALRGSEPVDEHHIRRIMFMIIATIFVAILICITGCSDTSSSSQNYDVSDNVSYVSEVLSLDETDESQVPNALIPSIMVDGTIYFLSQGYPIPDKEINLDQINYTESEIPLYTYPEKDGESNYAPAGTPYVRHGNGYALKIDEYGWTLFLTWEDRLAEE